MFLANPMENRLTAKCLNSKFNVEKPHVSGVILENHMFLANPMENRQTVNFVVNFFCGCKNTHNCSKTWFSSDYDSYRGHIQYDICQN